MTLKTSFLTQFATFFTSNLVMKLKIGSNREFHQELQLFQVRQQGQQRHRQLDQQLLHQLCDIVPHHRNKSLQFTLIFQPSTNYFF